MSSHKKIRIVYTYKGKRVTDAWYSSNKHLFLDPHPIVLNSAIELLGGLGNTVKNCVFVDEFGKVSYLDPEE